MEQQIAVLSTHAELRQSLTTIFRFLGEQVAFIDAIDAIDEQNHSLLILDDSQYLVDAGLADVVATPILFIGALTGEPKLEQYIGQVSDTLNYEGLMPLLHQAQSYRAAVLDKREMKRRNRRLFKQLVGRGLAINEIRHLIEQVAPTSANVLILGESGTGKEVVARAIHDTSDRADGPFVPVNCGAIPPDLLESELFGHEKGAFTGAFAARKGRFELAQGGTLFLDEIGDMPLPMQVKLLRVLQERVFERVGGSKAISADVRVLAATHRGLEQMIAEGKFREDLFYRLNVFPIEVPALRERCDDIPLLLQELIARHETVHGAMVRLTQRAMESLLNYNWPGNVRELSNLVERLVILYPNRIVDVGDLPPKYRFDEVGRADESRIDEVAERDALAAIFADDYAEPVTALSAPVESTNGSLNPAANKLAADEAINLKDMLAQFEIDMIRQALDNHEGVVARAAEQLGMRRTTLVEKMKKYGMGKDID